MVTIVSKAEVEHEAEAEADTRREKGQIASINYFRAERTWGVGILTLDPVFRSKHVRKAEKEARRRAAKGDDVTLETPDGVDLKLVDGEWRPLFEGHEVPPELAQMAGRAD